MARVARDEKRKARGARRLQRGLELLPDGDIAVAGRKTRRRGGLRAHGRDVPRKRRRSRRGKRQRKHERHGRDGAMHGHTNRSLPRRQLPKIRHQAPPPAARKADLPARHRRAPDEAQDINPVQRSILMKAGLPLIAVGDPFQQIYSWRGAENALAQIEGEVRYLTQSFRFAEDIAEHARAILATRPDGGPAQRLVGSGQGIPKNYKGPRVAIICRTNIGMIDEALRILRSGKKVHVDSVEALVSDVRSAEALQCGQKERMTSPELKQFESWEELAAEAEESGGALARLVQIVEGNRVGQVEALLRHQTKADSADILICTAHRSKGLEFPGVLLGGDWKDIDVMRTRHKVAQRETAKHVTLAIEEWNALYVAATRPMVRLQGLGRIMSPAREMEMSEEGHMPSSFEPADRAGMPS